MKRLDAASMFGQLLCKLGFHDFLVIDKKFGFGGSGDIETIQCRRCQATFTR